MKNYENHVKIVLKRKAISSKVESEQTFNGFIDENQFAPSYHVKSQ